MHRYLVRATVETPVCVRDIRRLSDPNSPGRFNFDMEYPDQIVRVSVTDNYTGTAELPEYHGLLVDIECTAPDANTATELALNHADSVLSMMSLATAAHVGTPRFQFAYDITEGVAPREYVFHVTSKYAERTAQRPAPQNRIGPIFLAFSEHQEKGAALGKRVRNKHYALGRAVRWLRKGFGEVDVLDAFVEFWVALESLDHALPRPKRPTPPMKCSTCGIELDPCPSCNKKSGANVSSSPLLAIQALCERNGLDEGHFKRLRDLRAAILHSRAALSGSNNDVIEKVKTELPTVRRLAVAGVCEGFQKFGLPESVAPEIQALPPLSEDYETWLRFSGYVDGMPEFDSEANRATPQIELKPEPKAVSVTDDDKLKVSEQVTISPKNCSIHGEYVVEIWSKGPLEAAHVSAGQ